jgi:hypothetical protein
VPLGSLDGPHDQGNGIGIGTEGWHGSGMVLPRPC